MEFSPFQLNYACFYKKDDPSATMFIAWAVDKKPGFLWHAARAYGKDNPVTKLVNWQDGDSRYVFLCNITTAINETEVLFLTIYQQAERNKWVNPITGLISPMEYRANFFVRDLRHRGFSFASALALCEGVLSETKISQLKVLYDCWHRNPRHHDIAKTKGSE